MADFAIHQAFKERNRRRYIIRMANLCGRYAKELLQWRFEHVAEGLIGVGEGAFFVSPGDTDEGIGGYNLQLLQCFRKGKRYGVIWFRLTLLIRLFHSV